MASPSDTKYSVCQPVDTGMPPKVGPRRPSPGKPRGFSHRGDQPFYPCSVVKLFYLVAAQARLEAGFIAPHEELDRAMRDMILVSSNTATNYVIDVVTGTTGDTLLPAADFAHWAEKRGWVNRYFRSFGWPELAPINLCQKLMDDQRYGRERQFVGVKTFKHESVCRRCLAFVPQEVAQQIPSLCGPERVFR